MPLDVEGLPLCCLGNSRDNLLVGGDGNVAAILLEDLERSMSLVLEAARDDGEVFILYTLYFILYTLSWKQHGMTVKSRSHSLMNISLCTCGVTAAELHNAHVPPYMRMSRTELDEHLVVEPVANT